LGIVGAPGAVDMPAVAGMGPFGAGVSGAGMTGGASSAGRSAAGSGGRSAAAGSGGRSAATGGVGGVVQGGAGGTGAAGSGATGATGETGRLIGMTAAHNAVRAMVQTTPALAPMTWSPTLAAYAQQWADMLASTPSSCKMPYHRSNPADPNNPKTPYGENLAAVYGSPPPMTTPKFAVDGWSAEVKCWTYGTITDPRTGAGTEKCNVACYEAMNSDGCGHYTQVVWRDSTQLGCGMSTCTADGLTHEIWICNYAAAGNIVGRAPY
jgi:pathogenesis-related protein 1